MGTLHKHCSHLFLYETVKGVVHLKKKTFADNLLTPMSSKMSMSFFLQCILMKAFQDFLHIMDFNGNQMVQGPNESFSSLLYIG